MTVWTIKADESEADGSADRTIRIIFDDDDSMGLSITRLASSGQVQLSPFGSGSNLDISIATKGSGKLSLPGSLLVAGGTVSGLVAPSAATDAVPKSYVDALPGTLVVEDGSSPPVTLTNEDEDDWLYAG